MWGALPPYPPFHNIKSYFSDFYFLRENIEKTMWRYHHLTVMLGEGRQSSLSGSRQHIMLGEGCQIFSQRRIYIFYRYFLHIFVNFSANESFAHVFIDNHTKCKSYFNDFLKRTSEKRCGAIIYNLTFTFYSYIRVCGGICQIIRICCILSVIC